MNLKKEDASQLQEYRYSDLSTEQIEALICNWNKKHSFIQIDESFSPDWNK